MSSPSPAADLPDASSAAGAAAPGASGLAAPEAIPGGATGESGMDVVMAETVPGLPRIHEEQVRRPLFTRRRAQLPITLFLLTCLATWFAGATKWVPFIYLGESLGVYLVGPSGNFAPGMNLDFMPLRQVIYVHWWDGLVYMMCVQLILFSHEMGHFLYAVYYRVRCTLPFFIPMPIMPTGTMGAVIAMEGHKANRPQIFDIGIAGPIAGLCLAAPILYIGVRYLNFDAPAGGGFALDLPLVLRWLVDAVHPGKLGGSNLIWISQANPWFVAGWFGLIMTALNMLPVSQLDGGHVTYTLWGKGAHWVARAFMVFVFAYIAFDLKHHSAGGLMAVLVLFIGTDHPPTSDDKAPIGWFRWLLGHTALIIPIICFTPRFLVIE